MTATIVDFEIIEHLDFEFDPPCEMEADCGKTATWKMTISCCGHTILCCEPCKNKIVEWAEHGRLEHNPVFGGCGSKDVTILVCEKL